MPQIPQELIAQIAAANDIVEVVGSYFPLKRKGSQYWATCPFHQEKTASFSVSPQKQIFKCFGCGAGGSVFRFVQLYENLDFPAAAKKLADRAGIKLVDAELSPEDKARHTMRRRLLALHAEAAQFFHHWLMKKPDAQVARDYLKSRGITGEVAKNWQLGYAPESWDGLLSFARREGFSDEEIRQSGLVSRREAEGGSGAGRWYDRFRGRVMFPICNDTGEVIAFSGRVLDPDAKAAKYVNSPETMLFTKGAVLFGLHKTKRALIDKQQAIVCEGQLDLITAYEHGVTNVIAPQGTAFTQRQAHTLKRYVDEVVLCFDADAAGEKAVERSLASLLAENLMVRVAEMPPGQDPDSLIRGRGAEAFRERIEQAKDFFEFQLERETSRPEFSSARGRVAAARKMASFIGLVTEPVLRGTLANRAATRIEVSPREFARLIPKEPGSRATDAPAEPVREVAKPVEMDLTMRLLTMVALRDESARAWLQEEPWEEVLPEEEDSALAIKVLSAEIDPQNPQTIEVFMTTLDAGEEATIASLLDEKAPEHALTIAHDCWRELQRRRISRRLVKKEWEMIAAVNSGDPRAPKLHQEFLDLQKRLSDIARPLSPPL